VYIVAPRRNTDNILCIHSATGCSNTNCRLKLHSFIAKNIYVFKITFIMSSILVNIEGVLDWMIGFIDTYYTPLGTTGNNSALADPHTLEYTVTHTLRFSVSLVVS
jgi:hypothetical protein